ncbi:MAG: PilZ domain-containing protein [Kiloniellales bacterium]
MTSAAAAGANSALHGVQGRRRLVQALMEISASLEIGAAGLGCVFIDLSVGEALLKLDQPVLGLHHDALQEGSVFELSVFNRLDAHAPGVLAVRLVWQRGSLVGVRFIDGAEIVATALRALLPDECIPFLPAEVLPEA